VAVARDEHLAQLEAALTNDPSAERRRRFVADFVRPYGLDQTATDRFVQQLEMWLQQPAPAARSVQTRGPARVALRALRALASTSRGRRWILDEREWAQHAARPASPAKPLTAKHR
jgi:hypothetical protein